MPHIRLVVIGASGSLGAEVARLGVAYGANVEGIDPQGPPGTGEPWESGVSWHSDAGVEPPEWLSEDDFVVVTAPVDPTSWIAAARAGRFQRLVLLKPAGSGADVRFSISGADPITIAAPGAIVEGDFQLNQLSATDETIRIERLAMALLRAAIDEPIASYLSHEALCELGDAMFWQ